MYSLKGSIYNFKKKRSKYYANERYVTQQLLKSLPHRQYAVISDLLLPNDGQFRTSQIDHLIISIYGIFCIETKSHKGWISGSKAHRLFKQILFRNSFRLTPNPVEQNNSHIRTVRGLIGERLKAPIVNIVVFPSAEKFFINGYEDVGSVNDMIDSVFMYGEKVYSYEEASKMIEVICQFNIKRPIEHLKHIERVRAVHV